jgi:hypothetical protein
MSASDPRLRTSRRGVALAAASAAVVAAGFAGVLVLVLGGTGAGSEESDLPTLPPTEERQPEVYGADGCVAVGDGQPADCGTTAGELDGILAGPPGDAFRTLAGFSGPRWTTELQRDRLVVLDDTVRATAEGLWSATGLARNEASSPQVDVTVHARLLDATGVELAVVDAPLAVAPLRPGEPAPFLVESDVAAADVASVEWSIDGAAGDAEQADTGRAFEISTYWTEPAGERTPPLSIADHQDPVSGPGPHLVFGSVSGLDGADGDQPTVVAAWIGEDGRVLHVADAAVVQVGGDEPLDHLGADGLGDFVLVLDGPETDALATAALALWAVGS